jgi:tetrahydromethanopterin S-methyltransferase subunit F
LTLLNVFIVDQGFTLLLTYCSIINSFSGYFSSSCYFPFEVSESRLVSGLTSELFSGFVRELFSGLVSELFSGLFSGLVSELVRGLVSGLIIWASTYFSSYIPSTFS